MRFEEICSSLRPIHLIFSVTFLTIDLRKKCIQPTIEIFTNTPVCLCAKTQYYASVFICLTVYYVDANLITSFACCSVILCSVFEVNSVLGCLCGTPFRSSRTDLWTSKERICGKENKLWIFSGDINFFN